MTTTTEEQIQQSLLGIIRKIAPEMDPASLDPTANIRSELDIDSMDYLRIIIAINKQFQVEIPEEDYGRLQSLDQLVKYISKQQTS